VSDSAKDLLGRMLVVDVRSRITADDALKHLWIQVTCLCCCCFFLPLDCKIMCDWPQKGQHPPGGATVSSLKIIITPLAVTTMVSVVLLSWHICSKSSPG